MAKQETKPGAPALLAAVQSATAADLETIRARVGELRKELDAMVAIERVVDIRLNGKPQRAAPGTKKTPKGEKSELAQNIYDDIAKYGPGTPSAIAKRTGLDSTKIAICVGRSNWFVRDTATGVVSIAKAG